MRVTFVCLILALLSLNAAAEIKLVANQNFVRHLANNAWQSGVVMHSLSEPIPFKEWTQRFPTESELLKPYAGFTEPTREVIENGILKKEVDEHHVSVARISFIINKAPGDLRINEFVNLEYLRQVDPTITHKAISGSDLFKNRKTGRPDFTPPDRAWCSAPNALCIESRWDYPLALKAAVVAVMLAENKIKDFYTLTQSELLPLSAEAAKRYRPLAADAEVIGGVQHTIFYVNQFLRWGKNIVIFQAHPFNPQQTVATAYLVTALNSKYYEIDKFKPGLAPILADKKLLPKDFFMGVSPANNPEGNTLMAGLPAYTAAMAKAMATYMNQ